MIRPGSVALLLLTLAGCAMATAESPTPTPPVPPSAAAPHAGKRPVILPGRVVVLAVSPDANNRVVAEAVARRLGQALHDRWGSVVGYDAFLKSAQGAVPLPEEMGLRLGLQGRPEGPDRQWLMERLGIQTAVLVELYDLEQFWGRKSKITRAGVDVRALHLPTGELLWRARYRPEVEGRPGRGVETAIELAVHQLVRAIHGEFQDPVSTQWWLWNR